MQQNRVHRLKYFFSKNKPLFFSLLFLIVYSTVVVFAAPPTTPYYPTDNITDPACAPGDTNCFVSVFPDQAGHAGEFLTTDGTIVSWTSVAAGGLAIGDTVTSGTSGSVLFVDSSNDLAQDNAAFYWDQVNDRLGIGTNTPTTKLSVVGTTEHTALETGALVRMYSSGSGIAGYFGSEGSAGFTIQSAIPGSQEYFLSLNPYGGDIGIGLGANSPDAALEIGPASLLSSGTRRSLQVSESYSTTNNSATYTALYFSPTINQTGAGVGAITGIDYNPTLTSVQGAHYAALFRSGRVGIGDATPAALLTVGNGDLFQVNSSGAIAAATGIASSGTINFSTLTASKVVFTDGSKNLTSTGTVGFDQGGTGLTSIGSANQLLGVNNAGTSLEYKTISVNAVAVANDVGVTLSGANAIVINLPNASATVRGVLSNSDWTTFNNKESALTFSTGLTRTINTITANLSTGVSGGQSVIGGTGAGENITLSSTTNGTKGKILFGASAYDEANNMLGLGLSSSLGARLHIVGSGSTSSTFTALFHNSTGTSNSFTVRDDGSVGVGTATFDGTNPEKFLVAAGTTTSVNAIKATGSINNYFQLNIQNQSSGTTASSDIVATADNGNETSGYIDMGINSSGYTGGVFGNANDAYLYNMAAGTGGNLLIGTGSAGKHLIFMTGGTAQSTNERMRLTDTGLGIGTTSALTKFNVSETATTSVRGILNSQYSASTDGARMLFRKGRGTLASPTVISSGDVLGDLIFEGYDGSNYLQMGSIQVSATGTVAATRVPTQMTFSTATNVAPSVLTTAITIDNRQNVRIGGTSASNAQLLVKGVSDDLLRLEYPGSVGAIWRVGTDGQTFWGASGNTISWYEASAAGSPQGATGGVHTAWRLNTTTAPTTNAAAFGFLQGTNWADTAGLNPTSGNINFFRIKSGFAPTSGTADFRTLYIDGALNQTGGANGITRGIYIDQTLTSVADYRAIDIARGRFVQTAGTMTGSQNAMNVTATLPSSGDVQGIRFVVTPGSGGAAQTALLVNLNAGYTGNSITIGMSGENVATSTGSDLRWSGTLQNFLGNSGLSYFAYGTTTGANIGAKAEALNGNLNVGGFFKAAGAKNSATNIGVVGQGRNTGTSPIQIGGWFTLANSAPTFTSAALVADNADQTSPIFLGRDNGTTVFNIVDGGNVGIGPIGGNPSQRLHVLGDAADTVVVRIQTSGGNTCDFSTITGTFSCASDMRLKNTITSISGSSALEKISALNPVTYHYNWQTGNDPLVAGFIAQEYETIFPELTSTNADGYKMINQAITPYMVKAIQELNIRVTALDVITGGNPDFAKRIYGFFDRLFNRNEICVDTELCLTRDDVRTLIDVARNQNHSPQAPQSEPAPEAEEEPQPEENQSPLPEEEIIQETETAPQTEQLPVESTPSESVTPEEDNV